MLISKFCGVISIYMFKNKLVLFVCAFLIGIIFILFSVIKLNYVYATEQLTNDHYTVSIVPFYWMILIIGGLIIVTLSYVSWRKYKGDKKSRQKRKPNH